MARRRRLSMAASLAGALAASLAYIATSGPENTPPSANAGSDGNAFAAIAYTLDGTCTDDGLPDPPAALTIAWSKTAGPGSCTFGNSALCDTTTTCTAAGNVTLQLSVDDDGAGPNAAVTDTLTLTVSATPWLDQLGVSANTCWCTSHQLRAAYTGALFEVQRTSDSAEQDISPTATGEVNLTALDTFCTGTECNVTTLYDPSGNGRNFTQATANRMPTVYESGAPITCGTAAKLCMDFDRTSGQEDFLARADSSGITGNAAVTLAFNARADMTSADNVAVALGPGSTGQGYFFIFFPAVARPVNSILSGLRSFNTAHATTTWQYFISSKANGVGIGSSTLEHDGTAMTEFGNLNPSNTTNITNTNTSVGAFNGGAFALDGRMSCGCIFSSVLAGDDLTDTRAFLGSLN